MKAFVTALIVFLLISGFVIFSSVSVSNECEKMLMLAEKFPESYGDFEKFDFAYTAFSGSWEKNRNKIRYFTGHSDSDAIDDALTEMNERQKLNDRAGYASAREKLISALTRTKESESFSFDSLF